MSYHCPKCQSVVYDGTKSSCAYCGAALPAEFTFADQETGSLKRQLGAATEMGRRRGPPMVALFYLMLAGGWAYLATRHHSTVEWFLAGLSFAAAAEAVHRHLKHKRRGGISVIPSA
jgi:hypothetical protein